MGRGPWALVRPILDEARPVNKDPLLLSGVLASLTPHCPCHAQDLEPFAASFCVLGRRFALLSLLWLMSPPVPILGLICSKDGHGDMYPNPPLFGGVYALFSLVFSYMCIHSPSRFFLSPSLNLLLSLVLLISATESYNSVLSFLLGNQSPLGLQAISTLRHPILHINRFQQFWSPSTLSPRRVLRKRTQLKTIDSVFKSWRYNVKKDKNPIWGGAVVSLRPVAAMERNHHHSRQSRCLS